MKIYKLNHSAKPEEIGTEYPQVQEFKSPYKVYARTSIWKVNPKGRIDFDLNVPKLKLHNMAKRTDLISDAMIGRHILIISKAFFKFLQRFSLPNKQVYTTSIHKGRNQWPYILFYSTNNSHQYLDFASTSFMLTSDSRTKNDTVQIVSWEEYEKKQKQYLGTYFTLIERFAFQEELIDVDIFRLYGPANGYFVKEKLKNAIEEAGFTGMAFEEVYSGV